jgi:TonB family protein
MWGSVMKLLIWTVAALIFGTPQTAMSPLGDDPTQFDQLLDGAYLHRDVAFIQAAVADDVRYALSSDTSAAVWSKRQLVSDVRSYDGRERNVIAARVGIVGDFLQTSGHLQVKTLRGDGPEFQVFYVRLYRRGVTGWQLTSHDVVWRENSALQTPSLPALQVRGAGPAISVGAQRATPPLGMFRQGEGVTLPRLLRDVRPQYTSDAMRERIEGTVLVEAVVGRDGAVGEVTIIRSLDRSYGLDDQAVKCAKQWQFMPGMRLGAAVPVVITIELTFTLRK